ncbi:MAG: collagen-like protein, partial [Myxococcales bacterium]|nr:collagen-like protein [Myxococcales bacterium]
GDAGEPGAPGEQGLAGADGASVTAMSLDAGDAVCAFGGTMFTVGLDHAYACNGAPGEIAGQGPPGPPGQDGASVAAMSIGPSTECQHGGAAFTVGDVTTYACNGAPGAQGPKGDQGDKGDKGDPGEQGPAGFVTGDRIYQRAASVVIPVGGIDHADASCDPGDKLIGGGRDIGGGYDPAAVGHHVYTDGPISATTWRTRVFNDTGNSGWNLPMTVTAKAICVDL